MIGNCGPSVVDPIVLRHINNLEYMKKKRIVESLLKGNSVDLETLMLLSGSSVYCFISDHKKRIQVYGTVNTLSHLARVIDEIKTSGEHTELLRDINDGVVQMVILESNVTDSDIRLKVGNWINEYECKGYLLYKDISPLQYSLETIVEYYKGKMCYCLYAKNKRGLRHLLGVFDKKRQLTSFTRENYKSKHISVLVYDSSVVVGNSK